MNKPEYVGVWVNVFFERHNEYMSFDEDFTSSGGGSESSTTPEIFSGCDMGDQFYKQATENCLKLGLKNGDINYVWLLFNEPESNGSDPYFLDEETTSMPGVKVTNKNKAAYIGHFLISRG